LTLRGVLRLGGVHTDGAIFIGALRKMKRKFGVDVAIELVAANESADASEKCFSSSEAWRCSFVLLVTQGQRGLDACGAARWNNARHDANA